MGRNTGVLLQYGDAKEEAFFPHSNVAQILVQGEKSKPAPDPEASKRTKETLAKSLWS
jgi:hypothetical protein